MRALGKLLGLWLNKITSMFKYIGKTVNKYYSYINPILIFTTTLASLFRTYSFPKNYATDHPVRYVLLNPIVENIIVIIFISAFLLLCVTIIEIANKRTIETLEEDNEKYRMLSNTISENIKELFNGFLYRFATSKADFTPTERITLYIHNGEDLFIPFGRYSSNPKYGKPGRDSYPDNQGCIAKGWENKWYFDNSFSDPVASRASLKDYIKENKDRYLIDRRTIIKLKMKATLLAVMRLDVKDTPVAVVVVESTYLNKYTENQIKLFLEEQQEYLAEMVVSLESYIPKPSNAIAIEEI